MDNDQNSISQFEIRLSKLEFDNEQLKNLVAKLKSENLQQDFKIKRLEEIHKQDGRT